MRLQFERRIHRVRDAACGDHRLAYLQVYNTENFHIGTQFVYELGRSHVTLLGVIQSGRKYCNSIYPIITFLYIRILA